MNVVITAAQALSTTQKAKLEKAVAKKLGKSQSSFDYHLDKSVLGGLRVTIGSSEFDATLENKLRQIKNELLEKI